MSSGLSNSCDLDASIFNLTNISLAFFFGDLGKQCRPRSDAAEVYIKFSKEVYARKRIHTGSSVRIENSVTRVTVRHHSASLVCRTVSLVTEFPIRTSQPLKILIVCTVRQWPHFPRNGIAAELPRGMRLI